MAFSMRGGAVRNASANGRYGTLSPISAHWPHSTVKPSLSAIRFASSTRRDLPMPASPLTRPVTARPAAASCQQGPQPGQLRIPSHQRAHVSIIGRGLTFRRTNYRLPPAAHVPAAGTTRPFGIRV